MSPLPSPAPADLLLFVPATTPERLAKPLACDALILDLEDAVAPDRKPLARTLLAASRALIAAAGKPVFLRINGAQTPWYAEDVALCAGLPLAGVLLPKAESAGQLRALRKALPEGLQCLALIETVRGLAAAAEIAQSADRLVFGSVDYCADCGCEHDRLALLVPRHLLIAASRLAGLPAPVDGVTTALRDAGRVGDDAAHAAMLGMGDKLLIHPAQIEPARAGFRPPAERIAWARAVLASDSRGAVAVAGAMVDAPVMAQARRILARAGLGESA